MDFKTYYKSLSKTEREKYALAANTTSEYIRIHLITKNKMPQKKLMQNLVEASKGKLTMQSLLDFFYGDAKAA